MTENSQVDIGYEDFAIVNEFYKNPAFLNFITPEYRMSDADSSAFQTIMSLIVSGKQNEAKEKIDNTKFDLPENREASLKIMLNAMAEYLPMKPGRAEDSVLESIEKESALCLSQDMDLSYPYNFAMLCLKIGHAELGIKLSEKALEVKPGFLRAHKSLAISCCFSGQWEKGEFHAKQALQRADKLEHSLLVLNCLITCLYRQGKSDQSPMSLAAIDNKGEKIDELLGFLPEIDMEAFDHSHHDKKIIFIFCDGKYFLKHTISLIYSICDSNNDVVIHAHIVNAEPHEREAAESMKGKIPLELVLSYEDADIAKYKSAMPGFCHKIYYSCVRFCRLYQLVFTNQHVIMQSDADVLFCRDINEVPGINDENIKIGVVTHGEQPLWEKITAIFSLFRNSEESRDYLKMVSALIIENMQRETSYWFLDQFSLSFAYEALPSTNYVQLLKAPLLNDMDCDESSITWSTVHSVDTNPKFTERINYLQKKYN